MLVLTRDKNEAIEIGEEVIVTVLEIRGDHVRLGIEAPRDIPVHRREVAEKIRQADREREQDAERVQQVQDSIDQANCE